MLAEPGTVPKTYRNGDMVEGAEEASNFGGRNEGKEASVKRVFQRNVVEGLESEDRELIRMLSYRDTNIARLLEKKHEKVAAC